MYLPKILIAVFGLIIAVPANAARTQAVAALPIQIELSHQLDEAHAARLEPLIERFNGQQKDICIKMVRRAEGSALKSLNLVTREEYSRFVAGKTKIKPLHEVMREARLPLDTRKFSHELLSNLTDAKGQLIALPVAFSTPVLYINKAVFRQAGLNPEKPPKNWLEVQEISGKLAESGCRCPFTTSWPVWVHIDNLSAWNGAEVSDTKNKLAFNGLVQIKHVAMMATWQKSNYFSYFGRRDEADRHFANGECAMLTSSSSLGASLAENKTLEIGVSALPYHNDVHSAPQNTLADGASLWISSGMKPTETKGIAKFVSYVLSTENQINLSLAGGFLPMTPVARASSDSKLLKTDQARLQVAYTQLHGKASAPSVRVSQIEPVRTIVEEELETVWANKKPAKEALDNAVQRGNSVMQPVLVAKAKRGK